VKCTAIVTPKIDPIRNVFVVVFRSIVFPPKIRLRPPELAPPLLQRCSVLIVYASYVPCGGTSTD
jgi:hypothetical protein